MNNRLKVSVFWTDHEQKPAGEPIASFWLFSDARIFCEAYSASNGEVAMVGNVETGISTAVYRDGKLELFDLEPLKAEAVA